MPGSSSRGIFLSYRREDAAPYARMLQRELRERFPDVRVFMDLGSIAKGLDFAEVIREAVYSCAVMVTLIGPQWATVADEFIGPQLPTVAEKQWRRRLDDPYDFVRFEIQTALELGVRVIPVLVDGAKPLQRDELPTGLQNLARLNALELSHARYDSDVQRLLASIARILGTGPDVGRAAATSPTDHSQQALGERPDVGRAAAAGPSTPLSWVRWLRGARARDGHSVFISFRHELSEMLARSVNEALIKHRYDTFVALENLDSGEFPQAILSQIEARQHFVVLLEPGSLDGIGNDGDWLRREIAHALAHNRNVVPMTHKGFKFRPDLVLPPDVARLPSFNAVDIPPGYFNDAMNKLRTRFLKMSSNP